MATRRWKLLLRMLIPRATASSSATAAHCTSNQKPLCRRVFSTTSTADANFEVTLSLVQFMARVKHEPLADGLRLAVEILTQQVDSEHEAQDVLVVAQTCPSKLSSPAGSGSECSYIA